MAAKKYLSLEEAAQLLGVRNDEVMRLRERGELRGFADRGTWKFKSDDVEEAKRRRQPDSNPEVPLIDDDSALEDSDSDVKFSPSMSDSDVRLIGRDDLKAQLTGSSGDIPVFPAKKGSDSDVRLVTSGGDVAKGTDSDSDVKLIKPKAGDEKITLSDSDSDVRLAAPNKLPLHDSDSDVRLAAPGSRLTDSDSDVRLAPMPGSDSDVKLVDPSGIQKGSGMSALPDMDALDLDLSDSVLLDDDSGIALQADSGIRLTGDSSLRLSNESGIQLRRPADSGILLERPGDSGFRLADDEDTAFKLAEDSGIKVGDEPPRSTSKLRQQPAASLSDDDLDMTAPMLLEDDNDLDRTDPEVPLLMEDDDDLMPKSPFQADQTQAETNVIMFDDDDDSEDELPTQTRRKGGSLSSKELATEAFDADSDDIIDEVFDADDDSFADEDMEEVFEGDGDEFEDSFSEGMSAADFSTARPMVGPIESEWTGSTVMLLTFSLIFLMCGAWVAADLLNTVAATGGAAYKGPLVEMIGGFFKS
ncbi:helix-turn-helix domain-containing protein [bacterium]|nr:helix-turn-helix domain-containing protein [bacterium]